MESGRCEEQDVWRAGGAKSGRCGTALWVGGRPQKREVEFEQGSMREWQRVRGMCERQGWNGKSCAVVAASERYVRASGRVGTEELWHINNKEAAEQRDQDEKQSGEPSGIGVEFA